MVGGSGLYIDSVLFDYRFGPAPDPTRRAALGNMSLIELQKHAQELGLTVKDINFHNKRHLARAIENNGVIKQEHRLRPNTLVIGLLLDRQRLYRRIHKRIENMIQTGFIDEVKQLAETYGWGSEAMTGIGYKAFRKYLEGDMTLKQAQEEFQKGDRQLAKKQRTWFRRNKYIQWLADPIQAVAIVTTFLNK